METQDLHRMIPAADHDEQARQMFVKDLRGHLAARVVPGIREVYERRVKPAVTKDLGREPQHKDEIRRAMEADSYYQFWSAMQRTSQERMWDSVIDTVERDHARLQAEFKALTADGANTRGSLRLNPDLEIPRYHRGVDIHIQPGGYHTDFDGDDVSAGALYDRGIAIYLGGATGPRNDMLARHNLSLMKALFADMQPTRILDMGCAIGNSTLPWAEAFPQAEVHGCDVGAPVLRYAHARAEVLGVPAHFSQQNAEHTDFPDGHFDLVVSCIMLHETSHRAFPKVMKESLRLLAPGGKMMHLEIPRAPDVFDGFMFDWESYNNNEPFSRGLRDTDLVRVAMDQGFDAATTRIEFARLGMDRGQRLYSDQFPGFPVLVGEKAA